MPGRRPSEICFFCPESLYQDLVRELTRGTRRSRAAVEKDFARYVELLLRRLVLQPEALRLLVSAGPRAGSVEPARAPKAKPNARAGSRKSAGGRRPSVKKRPIRRR